MSAAARVSLGLVGLAAAGLQVLVGAIASMGLAAPGVGSAADWVPQTLVYEGFTLVPIGFALCLWGSPWGLRLAALCGVVSVGLGIAAVILLADAGSGGAFAVYAVLPGLALGASIVYAYRHPSNRSS